MGTGGVIHAEFPQSERRLVTREFKDCLITKLRLLKCRIVPSTQTKNSGKQFVPLIIFRRMVIYPMDSAIQSFNNLDHAVGYLEVTGCSFNIPVSGIKLEHASKANLKQFLFLLAHRSRTA